MKRALLFPLLIAVLLLTACGGGHHSSIKRPATVGASRNLATLCPPGQSFMGCATPHKFGVTPNATVPAGRRFPDVSSYQGHPNWAVARPYISGGVAKAWEYGQDPDFTYNVAALKHLGLPWAAYDFVRYCDASGYIAVLRSVGGPTSLPPVIDMEVPSAGGCAPTLDRQIFAAFHRHPVIYTAPGTWPGGSNAGLPVWEATYGSSFSPIWHPVLAWQFTDGRWGSTVYIPGIGQGDVSVDYGFLAQVPNPNPLCYTHRIPAKTCSAVKAKVASQHRAATSSQRAYVARGCQVLAQRVSWFGSHLKSQPRTKVAYRRSALSSSRRAYQQRSCGVFTQRASYFTAASRRLEAAN